MSFRLFILVLFLIISIIWWLPTFNSKTPIQAENEQDITPEFTAKLLHQEIYDEHGQIQQEVFSKKMEHYADLSLTHFVEPEFIIYQDDKPHWRMLADLGNIQDEKLILDTNVVMLQIIENTLVNKITTEYLEIDLNSNMVNTDKAITIEGNKVFIVGKGLTANLNAGSIKLTNHVQTRIKNS